jgi:tyrosinase
MFRTENPPGALDHAPHCLRRDLNSPMAYNNTNQQIVDTLLAKPNIAAFQHYLSDPVPGTTSLAPHSGGHWAVGQDMHDVFVSPSDPVFWLHHGMVDLLWSRWQAKDPKNRQYALDGTITSFNNPPSVNATLDFVQDWGYLGKPMKIRELMDVTKGLYCYRYEYTEGALKPEGF